MTTSQEIRAGMKAVAKSISALPPDWWDGWVLYLLEVMESDGGATTEEFRLFLKNLQDDIGQRLTTGEW